MARHAFYPIVAPLLVAACVTATGAQVPRPTQIMHDVQERPAARATEERAERSATVPDVVPEPEPEPEHEARIELKTPAPPSPSFTRTIERARIEARGASRIGARVDLAALRAAALRDNRAWMGDERRELLGYLRGSVLVGDHSGEFTEADARIVVLLQAGSGALADGVLGDETMAVLLAMGFHFSPRKVASSQVTLDFYPGELEDLEAWNRELETKVAKNGGGFRDVTEPTGEGVLYVHVGASIVARYRARGGPPSAIPDGPKHTALPTKPGTYFLGPGRPHVTSNWYYSQIPWGAEIRKSEDGYQYRSPGGTTWSWATRHEEGKLKDPIATRDFEDLPEVTRAGETFLVWTKNDFGPIAWNLVPSDQYLHTTPLTEAQTLQPGVETDLGLSHGCVRVDPRERDEMMKRGYVRQDVRFVVRRWDRHLLPNEVRHEMIAARPPIVPGTPPAGTSP